MRIPFASTAIPLRFRDALKAVFPCLSLGHAAEGAARLFGYSSWYELNHTERCAKEAEPDIFRRYVEHWKSEKSAEELTPGPLEQYQNRALEKFIAGNFTSAQKSGMLNRLYFWAYTGKSPVKARVNAEGAKFFKAIQSHWFDRPLLPNTPLFRLPAKAVGDDAERVGDVATDGMLSYCAFARGVQNAVPNVKYATLNTYPVAANGLTWVGDPSEAVGAALQSTPIFTVEGVGLSTRIVQRKSFVFWVRDNPTALHNLASCVLSVDCCAPLDAAGAPELKLTITHSTPQNNEKILGALVASLEAVVVEACWRFYACQVGADTPSSTVTLIARGGSTDDITMTLLASQIHDWLANHGLGNVSTHVAPTYQFDEEPGDFFDE